MKTRTIFMCLRSRKRAILVILLAISLFLINNYYATIYYTNPVSLLRSIRPKTTQDGGTKLPESSPLRGYLVDSRGCRIPDLDPLDPEIRPYVEKARSIDCTSSTNPPLVDSNDTAIYINFGALKHYYVSIDELQCCWRSFWRNPTNDDKIEYDTTCNTFKDSVNIIDEFVKVECSKWGKIFYKDYHAFLPLTDQQTQKIKSNYNKEKLNVIMIGLDSVSRLNFHRSMPKTVELLENLGSIELLGYMKVGDNTYPNVVAVLTGFGEDEISDHGVNPEDKSYDDCPFIWKNFSARGYKTVFAEDAHTMATFNYYRSGFHIQPTDYYLRPYMVASENDLGYDICTGSRKTFDTLLDYGSKVAKHFQKTHEPHFAFLWQASLTHGDVNYPQLGDQSYSNLIKSFNDSGYLNNTVLIVMSDHGIRFGDFRQTYYGKLEESLPFVFFKFPNWWIDQHPTAISNLKRNVRVLTTPFDLHETLFDILNPEELIGDRQMNRLKNLRDSQKIPRGISLFLPIPDDRACDHAQIPNQWCVCHRGTDAPVSDILVQDNAKFLVNEVNAMLSKYPQCALLTMDSIKGAKLWVNTDVLYKTKINGEFLPWIDYTITIQTNPGNAIFEGTVRYGDVNVQRQLIGTVARLNIYGNQSACVDEAYMRLYCYCI